MITVTVPATTANLGPGFDCLGAALSLTNQFKFQKSPTTKIMARGLDAGKVLTDERNLAYQAFCYFYDSLDEDIPDIQLEIELGVPLARGLGSSATAIIGGLLGANALMDQPLNPRQLLDLAIEMEGHPDNVVPALLGGCQLTATGAGDQGWVTVPLAWHESVVPVIAIPEFELATQTARQVLPPHLSYGDAIFNAAHLALLIQGLGTGNAQWLAAGLQDRLHQPYRHSLIPGYEQVQIAALAAGAYGLVISGAGPTLLALTPPQSSQGVAEAMGSAWAKVGVLAQTQVTQLNVQGAEVA
ncbi:homoserine kinase [Thermosynechococcaceae cyanobacterium BACA0444]|uniref:Homoserine kinase n=1 Tax=Pseudocalidococcus azoricus BACA0444 TaxID=2918990 RepID=A0AAE4JYN6_9CYAN|nr:homoserine kinase [Pseudocalidococcus azoricus]MDS3861164.1 homoserine kinase [Pseudocalidococcus azoricus BACA0444]